MLLDGCQRVVVECAHGHQKTSLVYSTPMEAANLNIGDYFSCEVRARTECGVSVYTHTILGSHMYAVTQIYVKSIHGLMQVLARTHTYGVRESE